MPQRFRDEQRGLAEPGKGRLEIDSWRCDRVLNRQGRIAGVPGLVGDWKDFVARGLAAGWSLV